MDVGVCALGFVITRSALASSGLHRACARLRLRTRHRVIRVAHRRAVHYVRATRLQLPRSSPARPGHAARLCPSAARFYSVAGPICPSAGPVSGLCFTQDCCPTAGGCGCVYQESARLLQPITESLDFTTTSALPFVSSRFLCFCPCSVCSCLGTL